MQSNNNNLRFALLIIVPSFIIRLVCSFLFEIEPIPDAAEYLRVGNLLVTEGVFSSYKMMPLYPIIAAISHALGNIYLIDLLLSSCTTYLIFLLTREVFSNNKIAIVAAIIYMLYPFSIYYSFSGLTETSFTFFLVLSFLMLYRQKWLYASTFMLLSILIRPTLDYLAPILILYFSFFIHHNTAHNSLLNLLKYGLIYVLFLTPWWVHNYAKYDTFVRLNLGFGEMIYGGNNPENPEGRAIPINTSLGISDYVERNKALIRRAKTYIADNKQAFLLTSLKRIGYFLNPIPNHDAYKKGAMTWISLITITSLYMGFLFFLIFANKSLLFRCAPIFILALYLLAIHSFTIASIRYRYPLEPFFLLFLAYSVSQLLPEKLKVSMKQWR